MAPILSVALAVMALAPAAQGWEAPDGDEARKQTHITHEEFAPDTYAEPTEIDNRLFPLAPETQYILDGRGDRGAGLRPHRVVSTVTGVTKVVNGVRTLVVWARDLYHGPLVEEEIAASHKRV